ncbi:InlB B-repeat-containing protein [Cohnella abietis]|uniref:InlB B-repeat-containing protein n=1 Tax=Cohnella abietis TaxID=2507935 RepID=UPI0013904A1C|nr:InlB B-repeat-containing protein [Cohnella abietis]
MQQVAAAEPSGFQDVRPTDWFYDAAVYVQKNGIFSGTGAGIFSPKGTMTRAMYVTALGRMAGVDVSEYSTSTFADVQKGIWYAPYVEWAVKKGITAGMGDGIFAPDATVSREQMATMTLRYFESYQIPYETSNRVTTRPGDLANVSSWAADAVVKLWQAGVFLGDVNGKFNPHAQASRAEAAVLFMRNNAIVEAWANQNQETPTQTPVPMPTPTPMPTPGPGGNSGNGGGGDEGSTGTEYTLTFESNGGTEIADQKVRQGKALSRLPAPAKEGYIFQGWFRDSDLSLIFAEGSTVTADTKLYAKYIDSVNNAVQSTPSYSKMDVAPGFTIAVNDATGSLTASEVQAGIAFEDTSNPDFAGITVTGKNGLFTVASAADDGLFTEGNTYQLTLTDDNLSFQDQDATTSIYVFSVAKEEVMNIALNPNMKYLRFADVTDMMMNGAEVGSPAIPVITTTVGGSETGLVAANANRGTFAYTGILELQVGDTVAIYEGVRPDLRTVDTTGVDDGDVAYVQITAINGNTYTYDHADAKQVLFKPDVLPVSVEADTDGDPDNGSITVVHTAMNYSDSKYAPLGLDELTTVDVGDFIAFYEGKFGGQDSRVIGYGRITSITPDAEMDIITYTDATEEDIVHIFDVYQKQAIDGDQLLSKEDIAKLEDQIKKQAIASGFVDQAANYLSTLAMETDAFKTQMEVRMLSASKVAGKISVENLTVVPSLGTRVKHIAGQTSGVSASLQIGADIVIRIHEESDLVIHMTGTFLQEISLNLGVNGSTEWGEVCVWVLCIPYPNDYRVTADLDTYTYTGINITAKMATVEHDKLQDALDDWDKAATGGKLGKVRDIATEMQALINGVQDTSVDSAVLKAQYQEMMEKDTDWVPLIKKKLFEKSVRVVFSIIEVNFSAEFVVSANVNLTIGADFNYTTAKRYSATVRVLSFTGTSSTVSLPGDGNYQFTFYVMGSLGLRAGILLELKAGVGSVKLNSIGLSIEAGAYVNLWGYFYYQLKQLNGVQTTKSMGALYVEIGIYLESAVGAQLGDGLLSAKVPIYENTWPLYTVGQQQVIDDFAYSQDEAPELILAGSSSSIEVPQMLFSMSAFDLKTGNTDTLEYGLRYDLFDIRLDGDWNFMSRSTKEKIVIEVINRNLQTSRGSLVITWKGKAPLSFTSQPLKRTIPVIWMARAGDKTLQLDPQNGGVNQLIVAPYRAAIRATTPVYQGYKFDGWYTAASGGTKTTVPSVMPAEDQKLYAHWIANTNTPYTVQHYLIDPNTKTATSPVYTEKRTGTTGTEVRITSDRYKSIGYKDGTVSGVLIKGDGSTVVRLDYYPANRTMTFVGGYTGAPGSSLTEATGKNIAARIPLPTRPGYTFAGWLPDAPSAMPDVDTTYTAKWTAREDTPYQVVYLLQNIGTNTYTVADTELYRGTTDTEASLTNPTRSYEGFTFNGSVPGTVLAAPIAGKGTTVLKLYYMRSSPAMTINYNGSGVATKVVDVPFGATTELYLGTPTRQGHTFTGWLPASLTTMPAQAVEFTAQWTLNTHTVNFNSNGGSAVADQTVGYGSQASEPDEPTKDDLVFGGWYSDSALASDYNFATQVTADLTLYAKWLRSYTVRFDSNGGSEVADQKVNEGVKAAVPGAPTKEGYVFGGWHSDSGLTSRYDFEARTVAANITLYAKWAIAPKNNYTVSFNSNGGTAVAALTVEDGAVATAPGTPTKAGYVFGGWHSDSGLTRPFNFSTTPIETNLTLYAKWTTISYTVSFNSNSGSAVANQSVGYNGKAAAPAAPTRNGYKFVGWYSDAALTTAYNFATVVTANLTLYAKWTAVYTVSFNSNGGSNVAAQTVEYGGTAATPAVPTKTDYTFLGWYSDSSLTIGYIFTTPVTGNLTLYAKWKSNKFTVSFDSDGGSAVESRSVNPGEKLWSAPSKAPRWMGYRFEGWYSDPERTLVYDFTTPVTSDITLYAKWMMTTWLDLGELGENRVIKASNIVFDRRGTPYVAYVNSDSYEIRDFQVFVMKYEEGEWRVVGDLPAAAFYTNDSNHTKKLEITLAMDSEDTLYVAYYGKSQTLIVKKYIGDTWEDVGSIPKAGFGASIAFDKAGTPYMSYIEEVSSTVRYVNVVKYTTGKWVQIDRIKAFSYKTVIALDPSDTPYVFYAFEPSEGAYYRTAVMKYEGVGDVRKDIYPQANQLAHDFSASFALDPDGVPYMFYIEMNGSARARVEKYTGSAWETVGTTVLPAKPHYSAAGADDVSIAFDSEKIPYVAFRDSTQGDRMTVVKYENAAWNPVENAGFSEKVPSGLSIAIDSTDSIYVNYFEMGKNLTVLKYDPYFHQR